MESLAAFLEEETVHRRSVEQLSNLPSISQLVRSRAAFESPPSSTRAQSHHPSALLCSGRPSSLKKQKMNLTEGKAVTSRVWENEWKEVRKKAGCR